MDRTIPPSVVAVMDGLINGDPAARRNMIRYARSLVPETQPPERRAYPRSHYLHKYEIVFLPEYQDWGRNVAPETSANGWKQALLFLSMRDGYPDYEKLVQLHEEDGIVIRRINDFARPRVMD